MATGGSGDVLTGLLVGMLAQGMSPHDVAILGTYIHGQAGDHAATGKFTITATDIIMNIPGALHRLTNPI
jgi:NAD(P)H-hydrate epimerase